MRLRLVTIEIPKLQFSKIHFFDPLLSFILRKSDLFGSVFLQSHLKNNSKI